MTNDESGGSKLILFRLRPDKAEAIIRDRATASENVIVGKHARDRMVERDFTNMELFDILRTGHVTEEPESTPRGEWKCKVTKRLRGQREAGAVTVIMKDGFLFVKTVEWEDPQ